MNPLSVFRLLGVFTCALSIVAISFNESYAAPALSSRPGAAYTLYLNFDGFTFNGNWGGTGKAPGTTQAVGPDSSISLAWARVAEKYAAFDINVTTVDPAIAAGQASSDALRQAYYDATPRVMHTVVGGNGSWFAPAGGVSYIDVARRTVNPTRESKTNWVFPAMLSGSIKNVAEAAAHEDGHALGLDHQGDETNAYSSNNGAQGNNSYAPIMGNSYGSQKGTWSIGAVVNTTDEGVPTSLNRRQNDVSVILANSGMSLVSSGIGQSFASATALPITGTSINSALAQGIITPLISASNPASDLKALGVDNYTKDYFKFTVGTAGTVSLTVNNGGDWLTPGVVSDGGTLRSRLNIFSATDTTNPFAFGTENADATATTFTGNLAAGDYYAQITSFGGYQAAYSSYGITRQYFDMGSYTLSGTGFSAAVVVPEPGTVGFLALGLVGVVIKIRRKK